MASFTITDLPWDPDEAETAYLTAVCADAFRAWAAERREPHTCGKPHGGAVVETPDLDADGEPVLHPVTGEPTATRAHELEPRCHDCGRALVRPRGGASDAWHCPNARLELPYGGPDTATECGEAI